MILKSPPTVISVLTSHLIFNQVSSEAQDYFSGFGKNPGTEFLLLRIKNPVNVTQQLFFFSFLKLRDL